MIVRDLDGLAEMMHNHIGYIYNSVVSTLETESSFARRFLNGEQLLKKNASARSLSVEKSRETLWRIIYRLIADEKDLLVKMSSDAAGYDPAQAGLIGVFADEFDEKLKEMQRLASGSGITLE